MERLFCLHFVNMSKAKHAYQKERSDGIMFGSNDASASKPNGSVEVDGTVDREARRNLWKTVLKVGTWNVRLMNQGKMEIITREPENLIEMMLILQE